MISAAATGCQRRKEGLSATALGNAFLLLLHSAMRVSDQGSLVQSPFRRNVQCLSTLIYVPRPIVRLKTHLPPPSHPMSQDAPVINITKAKVQIACW
jgi:hypothetical protein